MYRTAPWGRPVQPLFDKDAMISIDSDYSSVLILHSTE